ncbi:MAG: type II secretion system protein [Patescibacteria group bacterium]
MSKFYNIKRVGSNSVSAKGFTLIEILIVIGIMALTSGMFIGYNRSGDEQIMLFKDQATLISAINRAKAFAQQRYRLTSGATACAFGIYIPASSYINTSRVLINNNPSRNLIIFADKRSRPNTTECVGVDYVNNIETYNGDYMYNPNHDEIIETLELDKRMKFMNAKDLHIAFIPPDLGLIINGNTNIQQQDITIQSIVSSMRSGTVTVSSGGQIITR